VNSTRAPESCSRDATASTPYPEKSGNTIPPILIAAKKAATSSGHIGMKMAMRSPGPTPRARSAFAHWFVSCHSSW
jgi:hypothetical protein